MVLGQTKLRTMSFEFKAVLNGKVSTESFINSFKRITDISVNLSSDKQHIEFHYDKKAKNLWGADGKMEIDEGNIYLVIHSGTLSQRENLIDTIKDTFGRSGFHVDFQEL